MRYIDPALQAKFQSALQTKANNADPAAIVWINRPTTPLTDPDFLERTPVGVTEGLTAIDVAMRRTRRGAEPDRAYVAYIADGTARVRSADLMPDVKKMVWTQEGFSAEADDVAICFDGTMVTAADGTAQFTTDDRPWVFWTKNGVLTGRILGLLGDTELASANATKVTAVLAPGGARDFGLVVFFLLNGAIYYRQCIDGVWMDAEAVSFGPSGVTWADIAAFRTLDYRIGLQAITTGGDVYELFTQFMGLAQRGAEHVSVDAMARGQMTQINHINAQEPEHVSLAAAAAQGPYGGFYQTGNPTITQAYNVDDGNGDFGKRLVLVFDRHLVAAEVAAQSTAFRITDSYQRVFVAQSAALRADGLTVDLSFMNFNAALGVCTASYTPGTVHTMAGASVPALTKFFTPTGLVPPAVPAPEVSTVANDSAAQITLTFDRELNGVLTGAASHFKVRISRAAYSPGGALSTVQLSVTGVTAPDDTQLVLMLAAGNRNNLETAVGSVYVVYDGAGPLVGEGGPVAPFTVSFTPTGVSYKPDVIDAEHIELSAAASGLLTRITNIYVQEPEHVSLSVAASGTLTHVNDL